MRDRISSLEDSLTWITARYDAQPGGGSGGDKIAGLTAELIDLREKLARKIADGERKQQQIETAIEFLDASERQVLYVRYWEGRRWCDVADQVGYSVQHIKKIHKRAIAKLKKGA